MARDKNAISLRGVTKTYTQRGRPSTLALDDVSFDVGDGEFVAIVGPSGCGKSTLLRLIAGLLQPSQGDVSVFDQKVTQAIRGVGIAFQSPVLMKWRTIYQNVRLPLEVLKQTGGDADQRIMDLLKLAGIAEFADRYPRELSGGMQQRAAICRALVHNPPLLLLDEPFGALDALTRSQMNVDLARIWMQSQKTTVLITHSISEAVFLADRVVVMSARPGRVADIVPIDLDRPRTVQVQGQPHFNELVGRIGALIGVQAF